MKRIYIIYSYSKIFRKEETCNKIIVCILSSRNNNFTKYMEINEKNQMYNKEFRYYFVVLSKWKNGLLKDFC